MQWLLAALVWVVLVGGLAGYLALRNQPEPGAQRQLVAAQTEVAVELVSTVDLGGAADPFALDATAAVDAVVLRLIDATGEERRVAVPTLAAGIEHRAPLEGFVHGRNELLVEVAPPSTTAALRCIVTVDGISQFEDTWWLDPGSPTVVAIPLRFAHAEHDHD